MRRILLLSSALACVMLAALHLPAGEPGPAADTPKKMRVACNLGALADYGTDLPFVDAMRICRPWKTIAADKALEYCDTNANVPVDENGYPLEIPYSDGKKPAQRVLTLTLVEIPKAMYPNGRFTLLFEGKGEIRLGWDGGNKSVEGKGGTTKFEFEINITGNCSRGLIVDLPRSEKSDHVRNIRLIMPGFADTYEKNPFHPNLLEMLKPFCAIRFMDWGCTNGSTQVEWAKRTRKASFCQTSGVAYEWMIDLCNTLNKDAWICCPHMANEEYQRELAKLIRDNLKPGLKVYIEWSNELWNGFQPAMFNYTANKGMALKLDTDKKKCNYKYNTYAAVRLFKVFDETFQNDHSRYVKVLSPQHGAFPISETMLAALQDPAINPDGVKADAAAYGVYFGFYANGKTATETLKQVAADIPNHVNILKKQKEMADKAGLVLISYEGGQHIATPAAAIPANKDPGMYQVYLDFLNAISPYLTMFNQYTVCGKYSNWGCWGAKEYVTQPLAEAPKYRALVDYLQGSLGNPAAPR
ncbi:MAG: hypothetical protein NTW87_01525 [Planctomycetota bacterium]|nr:hypothetical protein [Planctomycetota bacterium]